MSEQIELLAGSGWSACASIRDGLEKAGLPLPSASYLKAAFAPGHWDLAERATAALRKRFAGARYADQAAFGVLLVPDPNKLDTRGALDTAIRRDQTGAPDFVDPRLPAGRLVIEPGADWTMVATITGAAGISMGSFDDVRNDSPETYTVDGVDTRSLMVRQIWGARVLQRGAEPPDSNTGKAWTFTVFPGEDPVDGSAPSGTVLHGRIRFRLGRPDRGIAVVRVGPALVVSGSATPAGS